MLVGSGPLGVHLVAEEEVELGECSQVEVEAVGDQTDVVLPTLSQLSRIEEINLTIIIRIILIN